MAISTIFNVFARSPIKPLQDHMVKANQCTSLLMEFYQATTHQQWQQAKQIQQRIDKTEHEADKLKNELRRHLPKSLLLPVPRDAILELITVQDDIANKAEDIAGLILGRKMEIPQPLSKPMKHYLQACINVVEHAAAIIDELTELFETGFSQREIKHISKRIDEINQLERATDDEQVKLRAELFKIEDNYPPVHVMFLYQAIDWIGELADIAQQVGKRLLLLLAQ